jgi:hypothetical protein
MGRTVLEPRKDSSSHLLMSSVPERHGCPAARFGPTTQGFGQLGEFTGLGNPLVRTELGECVPIAVVGAVKVRLPVPESGRCLGVARHQGQLGQSLQGPSVARLLVKVLFQSTPFGLGVATAVGKPGR